MAGKRAMDELARNCVLVCTVLVLSSSRFVPTAAAIDVQAENMDGFPAENVRMRSNAAAQMTVWLENAAQSLTWSFRLNGRYSVQVTSVRYSIDGLQKALVLKLDGTEVGSFVAKNGSNFGLNWNIFKSTNETFQALVLGAGRHQLTLAIRNDSQPPDSYGVEIDQVSVLVTVLDDDLLLCP